MKNFKNVLLMTGILLGVSAQAGRIRNTGTAKAASNAGAKVYAGSVEMTNGIISQLGNTKNTLKVYFDKRQKGFRAVATGNVAANLYKEIVKTTTDTANLGIDTGKDFSNSALVLSGGAVDWAVELATGLTADTLGKAPYAGIFVLEITDNTQLFTRVITSNVKAAGLHVVNGSFGILGDTAKMIEDVASLAKCPVKTTGKYLYYLPGKILNVATLGFKAK